MLGVLHQDFESILGSLTLLYEDTNSRIQADDYSLTLILVGIYLTMRLVAYYQTENIQFYHSKTSKRMNDFLQKTKIREHKYTPHWVTLNGAIQCIMFIAVEIILKLVYPIKYEREMFQLSDGGTIAIDWVIDHEGGKPKRLSQRPIICLMSGLSGGNDNLYLYSMMKEAQKVGYKCVVINYRGTAGVKITSRKLYWMNGWRDLKEPIDYIHSQYCSGDDVQSRNLYAYAVSLGGGMLTLYLCNEGDKTPLSGAISYGMPHNLKNNVSFFRRNCFGFFDFSMGLLYSLVLQHELMPELKKYISEETYNDLQIKIKQNRFSLMDMDQQVMIPYMVGNNDLDKYYEETSAQGKLHKIKVPTFFMGALDDPCINETTYPFKEFENNENIIAGFTKRGGHASHFTGGFRPVSWYPAPLLEFFEFLENEKRAAKNLTPSCQK